MDIARRVYVINGKITKIVTIINFGNFAIIRVCYRCGTSKLAIVDFNKN